jgi:aminopeptidase
MRDPRDEQYARLLVEQCIDVQPGWQVMVNAGVLGRPLYEEVVRVIAERGAYPLSRLSFASGAGPSSLWVNNAPEELLTKLAPIDEYTFLEADALIAIVAPENTRDGVDVSPERLQLVQQAAHKVQDRLIGGDIPWVGCQYPTPALAQDAGMTLQQFSDFLYGAVLLDWEAERERMTKIKELFDDAAEVRIVGEETDLTLSLAGREGLVDAAGANIPGGEVFYSPVEDSAEGVIEFSEFPAVYAGREMTGIRFRFEGGRIVDASAQSNEDFLVQTLDVDEGARRLGEFGIGCNPGITKYMKNTLFDEKINGTVHLAVGRGFPFLGGTNVSAIHWDIVKDVRRNGRIEVNGELVQENGEWLHALPGRGNQGRATLGA